MYDKIYKSEELFLDECPCAYQLLNFVDNIKDTDVRWFFDVGYAYYKEDKYYVIFKSYVTDEYKDYVLSIEAAGKDGKYDIRIIKKIDNLLSGNG